MSIQISILLPTRGRTDALKRSVMSLIDTVDDPTAVELLLAFDNDDQQSSSWFMENVIPAVDQSGMTYTMMEFDPLGYLRLNEYVNSLAEHAQGEWLMFWNDDAVMETCAWDREIVKHSGKFLVLRMPTHNSHPYAIFPILPREWMKLFGYISAHQISDAWVSQIAYMLDIMQNIDVKVTHDRHDLTGNNADLTFHQRIMLEGRPSDPRDFNHISWRQRRQYDASRICELLESQGQKMEWYRAVVSGKQNPWAKMTSPEYDPNKQLTVYK